MLNFKLHLFLKVFPTSRCFPVPQSIACDKKYLTLLIFTDICTADLSVDIPQYLIFYMTKAGNQISYIKIALIKTRSVRGEFSDFTFTNIVWFD